MGKCFVCKIIALLVGVGALNWGLYGVFGINLVARVLGDGTMGAKVAYGTIGVAGVICLIGLIKSCPCCCKKTA